MKTTEIYVRVRSIPNPNRRVVVSHQNQCAVFNDDDINEEPVFGPMAFDLVEDACEEFQHDKQNPTTKPTRLEQKVVERLFSHTARKDSNHIVLAYGQTGSGKTHTIFGSAFSTFLAKDKNARTKLHLRHLSRRILAKAREGVLLRSVLGATDLSYFSGLFENPVDGVIFRVMQNLLSDTASVSDAIQEGKFPAVQITFTEVYRDRVTILCDCEIDHMEDLILLMFACCVQRATRETELNQLSSRSHAIIKLKGVNHSDHRQSRESLTIVDLAGSERLGNVADRSHLKETQSINKSLMSLARVVNCLGTHAPQELAPELSSTIDDLVECTGSGSNVMDEKDSNASSTTPPAHVPWRDSKLTQLLRPANAQPRSNPLESEYSSEESYFSVILCVNPRPECWNQCVHTLRFGESCRKIKNFGAHYDRRTSQSGIFTKHIYNTRSEAASQMDRLHMDPSQMDDKAFFEKSLESSSVFVVDKKDLERKMLENQAKIRELEQENTIFGEKLSEIEASIEGEGIITTSDGDSAYCTYRTGKNVENDRTLSTQSTRASSKTSTANGQSSTKERNNRSASKKQDSVSSGSNTTEKLEGISLKDYYAGADTTGKKSAKDSATDNVWSGIHTLRPGTSPDKKAKEAVEDELFDMNVQRPGTTPDFAGLRFDLKTSSEKSASKRSSASGTRSGMHSGLDECSPHDTVEEERRREIDREICGADGRGPPTLGSLTATLGEVDGRMRSTMKSVGSTIDSVKFTLKQGVDGQAGTHRPSPNKRRRQQQCSKFSDAETVSMYRNDSRASALIASEAEPPAEDSRSYRSSHAHSRAEQRDLPINDSGLVDFLFRQPEIRTLLETDGNLAERIRAKGGSFPFPMQTPQSQSQARSRSPKPTAAEQAPGSASPRYRKQTFNSNCRKRESRSPKPPTFPARRLSSPFRSGPRFRDLRARTDAREEATDRQGGFATNGFSSERSFSTRQNASVSRSSSKQFKIDISRSVSNIASKESRHSQVTQASNLFADRVANASATYGAASRGGNVAASRVGSVVEKYSTVSQLIMSGRMRIDSGRSRSPSQARLDDYAARLQSEVARLKSESRDKRPWAQPGVERRNPPAQRQEMRKQGAHRQGASSPRVTLAGSRSRFWHDSVDSGRIVDERMHQKLLRSQTPVEQGTPFNDADYPQRRSRTPVEKSRTPGPGERGTTPGEQHGSRGPLERRKISREEQGNFLKIRSENSPGHNDLNFSFVRARTPRDQMVAPRRSFQSIREEARRLLEQRSKGDSRSRPDWSASEPKSTEGGSTSINPSSSTYKTEDYNYYKNLSRPSFSSEIQGYIESRLGRHNFRARYERTGFGTSSRRDRSPREGATSPRDGNISPRGGSTSPLSADKQLFANKMLFSSRGPQTMSRRVTISNVRECRDSRPTSVERKRPASPEKSPGRTERNIYTSIAPAEPSPEKRPRSQRSSGVDLPEKKSRSQGSSANDKRMSSVSPALVQGVTVGAAAELDMQRNFFNADIEFRELKIDSWLEQRRKGREELDALEPTSHMENEIGLHRSSSKRSNDVKSSSANDSKNSASDQPRSDESKASPNDSLPSPTEHLPTFLEGKLQTALKGSPKDSESHSQQDTEVNTNGNGVPTDSKRSSPKDDSDVKTQSKISPTEGKPSPLALQVRLKAEGSSKSLKQSPHDAVKNRNEKQSMNGEENGVKSASHNSEESPADADDSEDKSCPVKRYTPLDSDGNLLKPSSTEISPADSWNDGDSTYCKGKDRSGRPLTKFALDNFMSSQKIVESSFASLDKQFSKRLLDSAEAYRQAEENVATIQQGSRPQTPAERLTRPERLIQAERYKTRRGSKSGSKSPIGKVNLRSDGSKRGLKPENSKQVNKKAEGSKQESLTVNVQPAGLKSTVTTANDSEEGVYTVPTSFFCTRVKDYHNSVKAAMSTMENGSLSRNFSDVNLNLSISNELKFQPKSSPNSMPSGWQMPGFDSFCGDMDRQDPTLECLGESTKPFTGTRKSSICETTQPSTETAKESLKWESVVSVKPAGKSTTLSDAKLIYTNTASMPVVEIQDEATQDS